MVASCGRSARTGLGGRRESSHSPRLDGSVAEHSLGKGEVPGSIPGRGSEVQAQPGSDTPGWTARGSSLTETAPRQAPTWENRSPCPVRVTSCERLHARHPASGVGGSQPGRCLRRRLWNRGRRIIPGCAPRSVHHAPLAQLVEHPALNRRVPGSNPGGRTRSLARVRDRLPAWRNWQTR